jgi:hypothetical protein
MIDWITVFWNMPTFYCSVALRAEFFSLLNNEAPDDAETNSVNAEITTFVIRLKSYV